MLLSSRNATTALPALMKNVMNGPVVNSRVGRTRELMHSTIVLGDPRQREILHPERKALYPAQIAETMWILAGRNDVWWLSHYLPRASEFSDDGKFWRGGYGPRLRGDAAAGADPLFEVIELLKEDPGTRRAVINIYDSREDLGVDSKDIPCNTLLHFIRNETGCLDLVVMVRSNDLMWGWSGINAFEWSAVLEIVARYAGMELARLVFHQSSLHLYERSWAKAERIARGESQPTPAKWSPEFNPDGARLGSLIDQWFRIEELIRVGSASMADIKGFPEPLMRSWLWVLWSWRLGKVAEPLRGTAQETALVQSPGWGDRAQKTALVQSPSWGNRTQAVPLSRMAAYIADLHTRKDKAYGDSWKRRGEKVAIQANIARKVDRLGVSDDDETELDTAVDLLVYLIKYRGWLAGHRDTEDHLVRASLAKLGQDQELQNRLIDRKQVVGFLRETFDNLLTVTIHEGKMELVAGMMAESWLLVKDLWAEREAGNAELRKALWKGQGATS